MSVSFTFSSALLSTALLTAALPAAAASFVTFQVPNGTNILVSRINGSGAVTGSYLDASSRTRGFVRSAAGQVTTFDYSGKQTTPTSIADDGTVVGYYNNDTGGLSAFTRSPSGVITPLAVPGSFSAAYAINNVGGTVGFYRDEQNQDFANRGFIGTPDGGFTSVALPPDSRGSVATAINDLGDGAGHYEYLKLNAVLWYVGFVQTAAGVATSFEAGSFTDPQMIPQTEVNGINNAGVAVGTFKGVMCPFNCATKSSQGFVRAATGQVTLFSVGTGSRTFTSVTAINNAGLAVGSSSTARGTSGFVRSAAGAITSFKVPKMVYTTPSSINDQGVIAGTSTQSGSFASYGFIRTP